MPGPGIRRIRPQRSKASINLIMDSRAVLCVSNHLSSALVNALAMACMGVLINGAEAYAIQKFCANEALDLDAGSSVDPIFDDNELLCPKVIVEPMVDFCFVR